ncbi:MAG: hypothetical protein KJ558_08070 [Gammaproteobacteria bacterium]|nr:hypothetical protein [Gammaproteobacteria bacterium]MBU1654769.1 hypothetical protein [Gammaproteobacteria bacterium]MBU1962081.1 hypothetical protein [Gammaproteobacteria bacterium]
MYPWLSRLHRRFPLLAAASLPALPLAVCLALLLWIGSDGRYALGYLADVAASSGSGQVVIELENPLYRWLKGEEENRLVVVKERLYFDSGAEDAFWFFVQGVPQPGGEFSLLQAESLASIPNPGGFNLALHALAKAAEIPLATIALGCVLILAGPRLVRLVIAFLSALLLGSALWHGLHLAAFHQALSLPDHGIGLLSAFALAAGLLMGLRLQGGLLHELMERLLLIAFAIAWVPMMAGRLGLPEDLALAGLVLLTLLSPWFGYAWLGTHWIATGLSATPPVIYAVFLVALFILATLNAASLPRNPLLAWLGEFVDPKTGRVPLHRILAKRRNGHENA